MVQSLRCRGYELVDASSISDWFLYTIRTPCIRYVLISMEDPGAAGRGAGGTRLIAGFCGPSVDVAGIDVALVITCFTSSLISGAFLSIGSGTAGAADLSLEGDPL